MSIIIIGFLIFTGIHCVSLNTQLRQSLIDRFTLNKYKALYSLIALIGMGMMFYARFWPGEYFKDVMEVIYINAHYLMLISCILITSAYIPKNHFKKILQHPMLIGIILWSSTHALMMTKLNLFLLFIGFSTFSIIMLIGLFKRDGLKEYGTHYLYDFLSIVMGVFTFFLLKLSHVYLAGIVV